MFDKAIGESVIRYGLLLHGSALKTIFSSIDTAQRRAANSSFKENCSERERSLKTVLTRAYNWLKLMSLIPDDIKRNSKQKGTLHLDKIRINYILDGKELFDMFYRDLLINSVIFLPIVAFKGKNF